MKATLSLWGITQWSPDRFTPPEVRPYVLTGIVRDHQRKADGTEVRTSPIIALEPDGSVRTQGGTIYVLELPHPDYIAFRTASGVSVDDAQMRGPSVALAAKLNTERGW